MAFLWREGSDDEPSDETFDEIVSNIRGIEMVLVAHPSSISSSSNLLHHSLPSHPKFL